MKPVYENVFYRVKNLFIWTSDKESHPTYFDHWASHADAVERGDVFRDDCDGFAMTCADLLAREGIDKSLIRLAMCRTETGEGHLVCIVDGYLLDNRQRTIWNWNEVPYTWESSMRMDEPGVWRSMRMEGK